ncbi:MAG: tRNA (N(6)-L-threonylcarbamoyladenosine(37)-C(2))-methylthiotransferase MtaB [Bdellovibrionales bacterium]
MTLGCRLNSYESEVIREHARAAGLDDVVIINSCAVTGEAERQTRQVIRKARREHPSGFLIVTGCAAHIHPDRFSSMPEVDAVVPNTDKLKADVYVALKEKRDYAPAFVEGALYDAPLVHGFEGKTRAFVQIQNGCNNACTFCIIPQGRGSSQSVALSRVIEQVRALAPHYPEITLTGVDIASYDLDGIKLGSLVKRLLAEVPELQRLRLSSLDPAVLDEDLWDVIACEERLMPSLHLSVQAGDDMILKRMKRRHNRQDVYDIVRRARAVRPEITFGADVIAGFPTEDEVMFENGYRLFEDLDFTWMHVFPYSPREGTPAARMPQVESKIRKMRAARLRELGGKAIQCHLESLVGQELSVHVEKETLGRTPTFAEIILDKPQVPATVVRVLVTGIDGQQAIGEVL